MKKIKVLMVITDVTSVGHFRIGWPGMYLRDNFSDEIEITVKFITDVVVWDVIELSRYDIIHYNRVFGLLESTVELLTLLRNAGIILIMDIDDYWEYPDEYPVKQWNLDQFEDWELGMEAHAIQILENVDYVTTTTEIFRQEILVHNKNVEVLPNAINLDHPMWKYKQEPRDIVKIGWLGSCQRYGDLVTLKESIENLYNDVELKGKFAFLQVGGDDIDNKIFEGPGFKHIKMQDAHVYGTNYKEVDISIAPLLDNKFNKCKSEIKMVEAGMNKKAFVGQDAVGIYPQHIIHGENGFLIKDTSEWYKYLKMLILDKDLRIRLGENLHKYVNPKFSIAEISKQRIAFYKKVMNEKVV